MAIGGPHDPFSPAARSAMRVGSVLGGWRITAFIGTDGTLVSYVAERTTALTGEVVRGRFEALVPGTGHEVATRGRLLRSVNIAAMVSHPGVPRRLDEGKDETGAPFVVNDVADGITLDRLQGSQVGQGEVLAVAIQLLDILATIHHAGIVHTGIEPRTLLVTTEPRLRLVDFGRAIVLASRGRPEDASATAFTPPEVALRRWDRVDARSDVFSVGALMFALLAGVPRRTLPSEEPPSIAAMLPGVDPEIAALVDRAMLADPSRRWLSAREMSGAAQWVANRVGGSLTALQRQLASGGTTGAGAEPARRVFEPETTEPIGRPGPSASPSTIDEEETAGHSGRRSPAHTLPFGRHLSAAPVPPQSSPVPRTPSFGPPPLRQLDPASETLANTGGPSGQTLPFSKGNAMAAKIRAVARGEVAPASQAASSPVSGSMRMSVERYATIQAETLGLKSAGEALARHGLDEASWAMHQRLMDEAVDQDTGDLAGELTAAIAAAMRRLRGKR